jgi:asparaginyl-tRNA synthetase
MSTHHFSDTSQGPKSSGANACDPATVPPLTGLPQCVADVLRDPSAGLELQVSGWVRTYRTSKNVAFLALGDGSTLQTLQVVIGPEVAGWETLAATCTTGASVTVHGVLQASPGKGQQVELLAQQVHVLGTADATTYPLQKKGHTLEFLRSITHLRSRSNTFGAVFRIRSTLAQATHTFFAAHNFACVHTPVITASDSEGAGEMFEIVQRDKKEPFFGKPAMLTVSGQLNGEALAYGLGRIYTFGPTFRAENSNTVRHLAEFWMLEPEMAFFDLKADMRLAEAYLKFVVGATMAAHGADLAFLAKHYDSELPQTLAAIVETPFAHVTYTQAVGLLEQSGHAFEQPVGWGRDLQSEHERWLTEQYFKKPVIVTDYPTGLKAFYMYQNDDGRTVAAMDVLVPRIGEIIGGSQREHRRDRLQQRMTDAGLDLDAYAWYLDLHRFGAVPHAGFGLGFERLVMLCTGMTNIRDTIAFPRAPGLVPC